MTNRLMHRPIHGGNLDWASQLVGCLPSAILDFSASINPLGPPKCAIAAITHHLHSLRAYPEPSYRILREALARHHGINLDWICPGNGSAELLTWVCRQLAQYTMTAIATPAFSDYGRSLSAHGANVAACSMMAGLSMTGNQVWQPDRLALNTLFGPVFTLESSLANISTNSLNTLEKPDALGKPDVLGEPNEIHESSCVLINNPHNPTGYLWQRDEVLSLLNRAAMVVVDEAFMDFLPPDKQHSVIDAVVEHPNLVVLRSLTKFYSLPGLRMGYAIAHPDHIQQWQQWRDPWPVNTLAAAAAIASLADTSFQHQTWTWLQSAKSQLIQGLNAIPGLTPYPGAANYLLVHATTSTVALQRALLEMDRLLIRDCMSFPELGDRYFRIAVRTTDENQRLLTALETVMA